MRAHLSMAGWTNPWISGKFTRAQQKHANPSPLTMVITGVLYLCSNVIRRVLSRITPLREIGRQGADTLDNPPQVLAQPLWRARLHLKPLEGHAGVCLRTFGLGDQQVTA